MARRRRKTLGRAAVFTHPSVTPRGLWPYVAGVALAFSALVAFDRLALGTAVLTSFQGLAPLSPLYAFWMPVWRPAAALFIVVAAAGVVLAPRLLEERWSDTAFAAVLLAFSLALPFTLFLVRESPGRLGMQFLIYPQEEYFDDARRITDVWGFIRHYTEIAPYLSLHGRVHPPGFALFLFTVGRLASPSPLAAGLAILVVSAGGIVLAWRAFCSVVSSREARVATLLVLAAPSILDFACTSMDAVFLAASCAVLTAAFAGLSRRGRWWHAVATGIALYVATLCSFAAALVALFLCIYAAMAWHYGAGRRIPVQIAVTSAAFLAVHVAVRVSSGFDLWESFVVARRQHYEIMQTVMGRSVWSAYGSITYGNVAALLIGTGLAIVPLFVRCVAGYGPVSPHLKCAVAATTVTLVATAAGGLFTMETERILMFAIPWLAMSASSSGHLSGSAVRLLLAAGWAQAFAMEVLLFTLW